MSPVNDGSTDGPNDGPNDASVDARPDGPGSYPGCPATVAEAMSRGEVLRTPQWGIGSAVVSIVAAIVLGLAAAIPLLLLDAPLPITALWGRWCPGSALPAGRCSSPAFGATDRASISAFASPGAMSVGEWPPVSWD